MALNIAKTTENEAFSGAPNDALDFNQVQLIAIDDIDTTERLRNADSDYAAAIASSIEKSGLLQPIDICQLPNQKSGKPYRLVAGGHRIEAILILAQRQKLSLNTHTIDPAADAARNAKWVEIMQPFTLNDKPAIPTFIRSNAADARREREIHENLFKTELKPFDRAKFIGELYEIERRKSGLYASDDGRKAGANARWNKPVHEFKKEVDYATDTMSLAYGFTDRVAQKIGLTARTVQRDLNLLRIPERLIERLQGSPILENANALKRLAKLPSDDRDAFVVQVEKGKDFKTAFDIVCGKIDAQTPAQKREAAFLKAFRALGPREAIAALDLISNELPKGVKIDFGGAK